MTKNSNCRVQPQVAQHRAIHALLKACLVFILALNIVWADRALAGCTDPAEPGVNWRRCLLDGRNLEGIDLSLSQIRGASFLRTLLNNADFSGADGFRSKFINAELDAAQFSKARLLEADFTKAKLINSNFTDADLRRARFINANLRSSNFSGASLRGANFQGADLSGAIWTDGQKVCENGSLGVCR